MEIIVFFGIRVLGTWQFTYHNNNLGIPSLVVELRVIDFRLLDY
jgi:hypothetical protein